MARSASSIRDRARRAAAAAVMLALAACTAADLSGMQTSLDQLLAPRPQAAAGSLPPTDRADPLASISDRALAAARASGAGGPATRVALYRVGSIAAWQAVAELSEDPGGSDGPRGAAIARMQANLDTAASEGEGQCRLLQAAAPPRDCAILALAPALARWDLVSRPWRGLTGRGPAQVEQARSGGGAPAFEAISAGYVQARTGQRVRTAESNASFREWLGRQDDAVLDLACRRVSIFPNTMLGTEEFQVAQRQRDDLQAALGGRPCP